MKEIVLLMKCMTRLPVLKTSKNNCEELGKSMKWFPVVGLLIGSINCVFLILFDIIFAGSLFMQVVGVTVVNVILTGGIHLDGLANTFDGVFGYRSKQKMLDIMKDSRLGTNGAMSLILYFAIKMSTLYLVFVVGTIYSKFFALILLAVVPRLNNVLNCALEPAAKSSGKGKIFSEHTTIKDFIFSSVISTLILLCVMILAKGKDLYFGFLISGVFIIPGITLLCGAVYGKLITRKIGGVTGDTLGALLELSEVLILVLINIFFSLTVLG